MSEAYQGSSDEAVDWLLRLRDPRAGEADWLAFDAWLSAAPSHQAAYDSAVALWAEVDTHGSALRRAMEEDGDKILQFRPRRTAPTRAWAAVAGGLLAATLVVAVVPWSELVSNSTVYATDVGQRRTVVLEDGSTVQIDAKSRLSVRYTKGERRVVMDDAEAVFDVSHNPDQPFVVQAGDRQVRVLGTKFDVRNRDGRLAVTVARGLVQVADDHGGDLARLPAGKHLDHVQGAAVSRVSDVSPDEALGWTSGRLVYRNASLATVAGDLNRYYAKPVRAEGAAADMRFSGVLVLDRQDAVIGRLAALTPVSARTDNGVIVLRSR